MKIKGNAVVLLTVAAILLLSASTVAYGQEERKIKMDEYKVQLAEEQARLADAEAKIATLEGEIAELKTEIASVEGDIDKTWSETYALLGVSEADVNDYRENLEGIDASIDALSGLSPEELFRKQEEIDEIAKRIEEAKGSNIAILTEMENKLADLDAKLADVKSKVPANIFDQYTVVKGDYLWKISGKEEIYGNPYQWIRIYSVNKDQIKDPNLIYAEQVFNIARGVGRNEVLVGKGDYLAKIAGCQKVFGDPKKWTRIYEANKDLISDPNLIYPFQVLQIPQE